VSIDEWKRELEVSIKLVLNRFPLGFMVTMYGRMELNIIC
jgi:hypothetical protein